MQIQRYAKPRNNIQRNKRADHDVKPVTLPDEFEKKDADQLSLSLGLSSNCHKMLEKYLKHLLFKKVAHGKYQKNNENEY